MASNDAVIAQIIEGAFTFVNHCIKGAAVYIAGTMFSKGSLQQGQCIEGGQCIEEARQANGFISGCQRAAANSSSAVAAVVVAAVVLTAAGAVAMVEHLTHLGFENALIFVFFFSVLGKSNCKQNSIRGIYTVYTFYDMDGS